jgi:hypothetical protein
LATNVNKDKDIIEYLLGFLDGFAYGWFDKGKFDFRWAEFEAATSSFPVHIFSKRWINLLGKLIRSKGQSNSGTSS